MSRKPIPPSIRAEIARRAGGKCEKCGEARPRLVTHHRIPYRETRDHSAANLLLICPNCHQDLHPPKEKPATGRKRGRPKWARYQKSNRQLLIEARAGLEIREVIAVAIDRGQTLAGACDYMREQFKAAPSPQVLLSWIDDLGGEVIKRVQWRVEWESEALAQPEAESEPAGAVA